MRMVKVVQRKLFGCPPYVQKLHRLESSRKCPECGKVWRR